MKLCVAAAFALLSLPATLFAGSSVDDCHAELAAYAGVRPYIVNPDVAERASTRIVAVFDYPSAPAAGRLLWTIDVRSAESGEIVRSFAGTERLRPGTQAGVEMNWDGRGHDGLPVPDGEYNLEARVEFLALGLSPHDESHAIAEPLAPTEAVSSPVSVVIDRGGRYDALFDRKLSEERRLEHAAASLDSSFPYTFHYGNTHAHTSWSDGGMPTGDCSSGRYGYAGGAQPSDAFTYAQTSGNLDFLAVIEHNHLMQEACSGCSATDVLNRYTNGFNAAANATVPGSFVALWGMEWGVISGGGHVNIYNQQQLMSWSGEPYHVEVPKSDYPSLYTAMAAHQGTLGSTGTFNHPESSDFGSWVRSSAGDQVMRGLSIISGPAFSTSTSFAPGGSTYGARYDQALSYGWKIAPEAHQDNHCWNYGSSTPNRTVALIPSGTTFDQSSLVAAMKALRIYAAQDLDVQLRWGTADGVRVMGESFGSSQSVSVRATASDPAGEGVQKIEIRAGRAGTVSSPGAAPAIVASVTAAATLDASLAPQTAGEEWYYYVVAVQADGDTIWSAPMWITWGSGAGGGGDTVAPSVAMTSPANGSNVSGTVNVTASASDDVGIARVEFALDGTLQSTDTSAPYAWNWNTAGVGNGSHNLTATAFDAAGNSSISGVTVSVSNGTGGGSGTSADVSGWVLTQANAAYTFTLPAGTLIPAGGYLVVGRNSEKSAFEAFWGRTLGSGVLYLNSADRMPVINGGETYQLSSNGGVVEGPTIAMGGSAAQAIQRANLCGAAGEAGSWTINGSSSATPGSGAPAGCGAGVRISEFSDASGTGNYIYEFIEIYNDAAATGGDTTPPSVSITAPSGGSTVSGTATISISASDDTGVASIEIRIDGSLAATLTSAPWEWSWDTTTAGNGAHTIGARAFDAAGNSADAAPSSVTVDNDVTSPSVSVTSPADGSSVSDIVTVAASATDASGIASVEFLLDGGVQSTDTSSPYEWSWDTRGASNGSHTLSARATDTHGNLATSASITVTVSNVSGADLTGWQLRQSNASLTWNLPASTVIPSGGYVVIGRNATRAAFEAFWGVTLPSNVVYVDSGDRMPQINGSESYSLYDATGSRLDGATISMSSSAGESLRRTDPCSRANKSSAWARSSATDANPGSGAPPSCGKGVYISEFSDALGSGNYIYEFIELHNDR